MTSEHPLAARREVLFGVATTEEILEDAADLGDLLDDLVDLPVGGIYFRTRVVAPTSYTQYSNRAALEGVRRLVEALRDNGRATALPQAGLAGWLMLPFGATAFGSGITASLQRFVAPTSGFGRPLEWYFMPQLLGFVLRSEVLPMNARLNWDLCDCPYCRNLSFAGGLWNRDAAGLHYLWWCSRLANELVGEGDSAQVVRDRLEEARGNWGRFRQPTYFLMIARNHGIWKSGLR